MISTDLLPKTAGWILAHAIAPRVVCLNPGHRCLIYKKKCRILNLFNTQFFFAEIQQPGARPPSINLTRAKQSKLLSLDGWQPPLHFKLQVARRIHAFVQYPDDDDSIVADSKVNHMSLNTPSAIALQDELTAWRCFGGDS